MVRKDKKWTKSHKKIFNFDIFIKNCLCDYLKRLYIIDESNITLIKMYRLSIRLFGLN